MRIGDWSSDVCSSDLLCADHLAVLVILQFGHAFSFAAYHAVAMRYVQSMFPGALQGRGQAIYNAAAYGIGGSIGSVTSGFRWRSEEHTSELQSLMRISYDVFCLKKKK